MYNDESSHSSQSQGQGAFVRRPIPKYNGEKSGGEYQQSPSQSGGGYSGGSSGYSGGSGYRSGGYGRDRDRQGGDGTQSSYAGSSPRGRRPDGGSSGYGGGSGSGYRSGGSYGYNNRTNNYGSNDRLVRQNDIIIQLLKDIRDRLPAPPAGVSTSAGTSDSYSSDRSSYSSHKSSYLGSDDDGADFDVSGGSRGVDGVGQSSTAGRGDDADGENGFNS